MVATISSTAETLLPSRWPPAIRTVSFVVIAIIMAVMANTMAMSARERLSEYATLKALGFRPGFLRRLIAGESLLIALAGGGIGIAATFPVTAAFGPALGTLFPVFQVSTQTILLQLCAALVVGLVAHDGQSNWLEGLLLLAVYVLLAIAFFHLPGPEHAAAQTAAPRLIAVCTT